MEQLIDDYLREAEIPTTKEHDEYGDPMYFTELELNEGTFRLSIIVSTEHQNVTLMLNSPINVPPPKRPEVAEYLARVNFHSYEGNMIMDFKDGHLAFKSSLRYDPDRDITHVRYQLNIALGIALEEMETYFSGLLSIIYQDVSPEQAYSKAGLGTNPNLN